MADVDELNDAGAADGEKDLVADFLMREQDKLAGLEDDFGMSNIRSPPHNVASVYRRFSCSIQQSSCYTCYTEDSCRPAIIDSRQKQLSQISFHTLSFQKI